MMTVPRPAAPNGPRPAPITDISPQEAIDLGFTPIPLCSSGERKAPRPKAWEQRTFTPDEWEPGESVGLRTGPQADGTYLYVVDLDHRPALGVFAPAEFAAALERIPEPTRTRLVTAYSTGRMGRYIIFRSTREVRSGTLRNADKQKIGDFLGPGKQVVAPTHERLIQGSLSAVPLLSDAEPDIVLAAVGYTSGGDSARADVDHAAVSYHLSHLDHLLRRVKPHTLTYQQLHSDGGPDRSARRWGLACELRKRYGFPNEEIAALLIGFTDWGHSAEKGSDWFYADVQRCIDDAVELYPDVKTNPTRYMLSRPVAALPDVPRKSRARKDRPQRIDADGLYEWYTERWKTADGKILYTRRQAADAHSISLRTLDRLEQQLRERGLIERHTSKDRQSSWVMLVGTAIMPAEPAAAAAEPAPEVLPESPRIEDARTREKKHILAVPGPCPEPTPEPPAPAGAPDHAATPAAVTLVELVRAILLAYPRARLPRLVRLVREHAPPDARWTDDAITWHIRTLRRRMHYERTLAKLPDMKHGRLLALDRWCQRVIHDGDDGPEADRLAFARWLAPHVAAELDRRAPMMRRQKAGQRRTPAPVPSLFPLADAAPAAPEPPRDLSGGVCSSPGPRPVYDPAMGQHTPRLAAPTVAPGYIPPLRSGQIPGTRVVVRGAP